MKALPLLAAAVLLAGCDVKKALSLDEPATPAPVVQAATPKPTPKPGAWMFDKNHRSALDPPEHQSHR